MLNYPEIMKGFGDVDGEGDSKKGKKVEGEQVDGVVQDGRNVEGVQVDGVVQDGENGSRVDAVFQDVGSRLKIGSGSDVVEKTSELTEVVRRSFDIGGYTIYCRKDAWKKDVEGDE